MAITELPYQDIIDRSSGPSSEGFSVNEIRYSGKVSQRTFDGPNIDTSKTDIWKVTWKLLEFGDNVEYDIKVIREFYRQAQLGMVRWRPFELDNSIIWRVVSNSLKVSNPSGCIFEASLSLEYLYEE